MDESKGNSLVIWYRSFVSLALGSTMYANLSNATSVGLPRPLERSEISCPSSEGAQEASLFNRLPNTINDVKLKPEPCSLSPTSNKRDPNWERLLLYDFPVCASQYPTTDICPDVIVPVLSEQRTETLPRLSMEARLRTITLCFAIANTPVTRTMVVKRGIF